MLTVTLLKSGSQASNLLCACFSSTSDEVPRWFGSSSMLMGPTHSHISSVICAYTLLPINFQVREERPRDRARPVPLQTSNRRFKSSHKHIYQVHSRFSVRRLYQKIPLILEARWRNGIRTRRHRTVTRVCPASSPSASASGGLALKGAKGKLFTAQVSCPDFSSLQYEGKVEVMPQIYVPTKAAYLH